MVQLVLIFVGGGLGAIARWQLSGLVLHRTVDWRFPLGTFIVNVVGCLVAGLLAGLVTKLDIFSADTRLFLFTGLLGGFTTFSAFGVETIYLLRRHEYGVAVGYVLLSVLCGVAGLGLTMWLVPAKSSS
jgi:fluoride exporter